MKWTTHSIFGAALTAWVLVLFQTAVMPVVIILGALGALFPDIDHPNSKASNANVFTKILSILVIIAISVFNIVFNFFGGIINTFSPGRVKNLTGVHRSPVTHSLLTVFLFAVIASPLLFFLPVWWYAALVIGVLSHVIIDSFNPSGTPLFWPLNQGRTRFIPEAIAPTTGTLGEGLVTLIVIALLGIGLLVGWTTNGVGFSDFTELLSGSTGSQAKNIPGVKDINYNKIPTNVLPAGSIKLPDGSIVLPDGKPIKELSITELKKLGINTDSIKKVKTDGGITKDEKKKVQVEGQSFLEKSGILNLWKIFSEQLGKPLNTDMPDNK